MRFEKTIDIAAPASVAWSVMSDIARWPEWTSTVTSILPEDGHPLRVGTKAKLALRGAPKSEWVVTALHPGTSFTWESKMLGVTSTATHEIVQTASGCRVTLTVQYRGPATVFFRPFLKRTSIRNLEIESAGLKQRSEELARAAA